MALIYYEFSKAVILKIGFGYGSQDNASCWGRGELNTAMNQISFQLLATVLGQYELKDWNVLISGSPSLSLHG